VSGDHGHMRRTIDGSTETNRRSSRGLLPTPVPANTAVDRRSTIHLVARIDIDALMIVPRNEIDEQDDRFSGIPMESGRGDRVQDRRQSASEQRDEPTESLRPRRSRVDDHGSDRRRFVTSASPSDGSHSHNARSVFPTFDYCVVAVSDENHIPSPPIVLSLAFRGRIRFSRGVHDS